MAALTRLFLAGAATVLIHEPFASCNEEQKILETEVVNCLAEFNKAREAAGLPELEEPYPKSFEDYKYPSKRRSNHHGLSVAEHQCRDAYLTFKQDHAFKTTGRVDQAASSGITRVEHSDEDGDTWMYFEYSGSDDCRAAVEAWKEAGKGFDDIPPPYQSQFESPYADSAKRSFVGLFNPNSSATMECLRITCKFTENGESIDTRALLCATEPQALRKNESPFGEDVWKKIKKSLESEKRIDAEGTPNGAGEKNLRGESGASRENSATGGNSGDSASQNGPQGTKDGAGGASEAKDAEGDEGSKGNSGITDNNGAKRSKRAARDKSIEPRRRTGGGKGSRRSKSTVNNGAAGNEASNGSTTNTESELKDAGEPQNPAPDNGSSGLEDSDDETEANNDDSIKGKNSSTPVSTTAATVFVFGCSVLSIFSYL